MPGVPAKLVCRPPPELAAVPPLAAGAGKDETVAKMPGSLERGEPGQQVARGKVTGRPEYRQPTDHDSVPALARAIVTPLAMTPIWLNACG